MWNRCVNEWTPDQKECGHRLADIKKELDPYRQWPKHTHKHTICSVLWPRSHQWHLICVWKYRHYDKSIALWKWMWNYLQYLHCWMTAMLRPDNSSPFKDMWYMTWAIWNSTRSKNFSIFDFRKSILEWSRNLSLCNILMALFWSMNSGCSVLLYVLPQISTQ